MQGRLLKAQKWEESLHHPFLWGRMILKYLDHVWEHHHVSLNAIWSNFIPEKRWFMVFIKWFMSSCSQDRPSLVSKNIPGIPGSWKLLSSKNHQGMGQGGQLSSSTAEDTEVEYLWMTQIPSVTHKRSPWELEPCMDSMTVCSLKSGQRMLSCFQLSRERLLMTCWQ